MNKIDDFDIVVLGTGCPKCKKLSENTKQAIEESGIDKTFNYITDPLLMAKMGILSSPALLINNKVVSTGKLLEVKEIINLFKDNNIL